jgi:hypothetical protein
LAAGPSAVRGFSDVKVFLDMTILATPAEFIIKKNGRFKESD